MPLTDGIDELRKFFVYGDNGNISYVQVDGVTIENYLSNQQNNQPKSKSKYTSQQELENALRAALAHLAKLCRANTISSSQFKTVNIYCTNALNALMVKNNDSVTKNIDLFLEESNTIAKSLTNQEFSVLKALQNVICKLFNALIPSSYGNVFSRWDCGLFKKTQNFDKLDLDKLDLENCNKQVRTTHQAL